MVAGAALEQPLPLEPIDHPRETAAGQLGLLGQVAHAHPTPRCLLQMVEHLIGGHGQVVCPLELSIQALGQTGVGPEQSAPGTKLPQGEGLLVGGWNLDGGRS